MRRNTLLIDADDTLWENNVFFEKLIEDFITLVESCGFTRAYVRHILNETERKNIRQYGYGVRSFGRSLEETYIIIGRASGQREVLAQIHTRVVDLERTSAQNPRWRSGDAGLTDRAAPADSLHQRASPPNRRQRSSAPGCRAFRVH